MRECDTSQGKPACRIDEPITTPYHDLPPLKKPKVQTTGPVRYDLPGELPQPQEKLKDTITPMVVEEQPAPPCRAQHLPNEPDSSEDDGMSDSSLSDAVVIWASGLELYTCLLSCTIYYHQPLVPL
jgi:hypothetical protein